MDTPQFFIAQLNVARALAPMDDSLMADFMNQLDAINALAEQTPGFVWRLKGDDNNATSIQVYDDPMIIVNMSVWESIDQLYRFTYYTAHVEVFRRRAEWFEKFGRPYQVLWWVPAWHEPTTAEARRRLEYLQQNGPTEHAFTFKKRFSQPKLPQPK